jgi:hypothetical protein
MAIRVVNKIPFEEIKERAKCKECLREEYCKRIPVNDLIVQAIKENGKCPDFITTASPPPASF